MQIKFNKNSYFLYYYIKYDTSFYFIVYFLFNYYQTYAEFSNIKKNLNLIIV